MNPNFEFHSLSDPPTQSEIDFLYELMLERRYNISHSICPSILEHEHFVRNHPYKDWLIVCMKGECIASLYLGFDNSVGIHLLEEYSHLLPIVLAEFERSFDPLPSKPSVVRGEFFFNVAPDDVEKIRQFEDSGYAIIQFTFCKKKNK